MFTVVNLSRFLKVDAESALLNSNRKFRRRFSYVEQQATKDTKTWHDFTLEQLDGFWNEAKNFEK